MEPASPLKSITNTTQLAPSQTVQTAGIASKSSTDNSSNASSVSSTANSKINHNSNETKIANLSFPQLFTADDNNLFSHNNNNSSSLSNANNLQQNSHNGNGLSNGSGNLLNGYNRTTASNQNVITKNSLNLQQSASNNNNNNNNSSSNNNNNYNHSNNNNNKFTPDADFEADFSSANIYNATNASSLAKPAVTSNGYQLNGFSKLANGTASDSIQTNGTGDKNANENFADFEHNTIYNAAGN